MTVFRKGMHDHIVGYTGTPVPGVHLIRLYVHERGGFLFAGMLVYTLEPCAVKPTILHAKTSKMKTSYTYTHT